MLRRRSKTKRQTPGPAEHHGAHVLLVEDNPDIAELLSRLLQASEFEPLVAASPDDAFGALEQAGGHVDVVVVDLRPDNEPSSVEVLEQIRAHQDTEVAQTRVIVVSETQERLPAWQSAADGLLSRPFRADELVASVSDALSRSADERASYRNEQIEADQHRAAG